MKKTLVLCSLLLFLLVGCSQKNVNQYKGEYGTYEIINTHLIKDSLMLNKNFDQVQWKIKYTNTTSEARKPIDAIKSDMVVENETNVELNEIPFSAIIFYEGKSQGTKEEQDLVKNRTLNIKPGATVEIIVGSTIEKSKIDSMFLRDRNIEGGKNGKKFEKKFSVK